MFYSCAKLNAFKLPDLTSIDPAGGIIAASAMPCGVLQRRSFIKFPHLRHRMFDPQLYLAGLNANTAATTVFKLSTYRWFGVSLPEYDSDVHATHIKYKEEMLQRAAERWTGKVAQDDKGIRKCVSTALDFQVKLGCEVLIAPVPLTTTFNGYELEARYLDAACKYVTDEQIKLPLLASVVISDALLRNFAPLNSPLLNTITGHIAARKEVAGAYLTLDQTADTGYVCNNEDSLLSLLMIVDDIVKGAGKRVVANYLGSFGLILSAVGADVWASGFYRSQRRMRLADQEEQEGRAYPRFFSRVTLGDIGLDADLPILFRQPQLFQKVFTNTPASNPLLRSLQATGNISSAPGWIYKPGNIAAAAAHYLDACSQLDAYFDSFSDEDRVDAIDKWLASSVNQAKKIKELSVSSKTDTQHQAVWLSAFRKWRAT